MSDNADLASLTETCATIQTSFSGDTADFQAVALAGATGSEGSWTVGIIPGDATDGLLVNLGTNNDVTVTGTVTANLSATDNAVLDTIDAVLDTINAKLVTGTVIGDVNLGATDNAVLDSIDTAVNLIDNTVYVDDADWTALTSSHNLIGGIYQSSPGAITDGDTGPIRLTSTGAVHVSDAGGSLTVDNAGLTELAAAIGATSANQLDVNIAGNALASSSETIDAVAGTTVTHLGAARDDALSTLTPVEGDIVGLFASAEGALWTQDFNSDTMVTHLATLAGAVSTEMQVDIVGSLPAGTNGIGKLTANSGVDIGDVDVTSISAGSNAIGDVGITTRTSGGTSTYYNDGAVTLASIKASAGQIYAIEVTNKSSTLYYLQLFNLGTGSVTLGTTTPTNEYVIPHNSGNGGGFVRTIPVGRAYGTAISYAITTTKGGAVTGTADDVLLNVDYA